MLWAACAQCAVVLECLGSLPRLPSPLPPPALHPDWAAAGYGFFSFFLSASHSNIPTLCSAKSFARAAAVAPHSATALLGVMQAQKDLSAIGIDKIAHDVTRPFALSHLNAVVIAFAVQVLSALGHAFSEGAAFGTSHTLDHVLFRGAMQRMVAHGLVGQGVFLPAIVLPPLVTCGG
jgi:hypothetical protein